MTRSARPEGRSDTGEATRATILERTGPVLDRLLRLTRVPLVRGPADDVVGIAWSLRQ